MSKKLFVTGTGTDVGKTFVTGLMLKKLKESGERAAYYKAAMSGNERDDCGNLIPGDGVYVKKISGIEEPAEEMCPYLYEQAVSPHLASRTEGESVDLRRVLDGLTRLDEKYDFVTMEGSGGILCPLRYDEEKLFLPDVIRAGNLSCLLVAESGLGTINSVGLTAYYLRQNNIPLRGLVFNRFHPGDPLEEDNLKMCEQITGVRAVFRVREGDADLDISAEDLKFLYV